MTVSVLLFARYQEAAGRDRLRIEIPAPATLWQVWQQVQVAVPSLRGEMRPLLACNRCYAPPDRVVDDADEIAVFPPVSGG